MHLLRTTTRTIDEAESAVDLGQTPGAIVFLSFSDSDLGLAAAALEDRQSADVRLASLAALRHPYSVDLYIESVAAQARFVLVRLLGGLDYWRYGAQELAAAARRHHFDLALIPGDGRADPRLDVLSTLPVATLRAISSSFDCGGSGNLANLFAWIERRSEGETGQLPEPQSTPACGLFAAACRSGASDAPLGVIVFYRAYLLAGDVAPIVAVANALAARGLRVLAAYVPSLKDAEAGIWLSELLAKEKPDVILNSTAFAARMDQARSPLESADAPILQMIHASTSRASWDGDMRGLGAADLAMNVVLPELDGRIITRTISFKEETERSAALQFTRVVHQPDAARIAFVADLAKAWARLRRTKRGERRPACILSDYPAKAGRAAYAVGLDTPASLVEIATRLKAAAYDIEAIHDGDAIVRTLAEGAPRESLLLPRYEEAFAALPEILRAAIVAAWGAPDVDPHVEHGAFQFRAVRLGKMIVAIQPDRGGPAQHKADYHDARLPPSHFYVAFYLWLRHVERIDAMIQLGTHGTLEWLPGKATALSESCAPEALLGPVPLIYPFIVNNPGEAAQAKRRAGAVIVGHLTPPLGPAGSAGDLAEFEALFDEYASAQQMDPKRAALLAETILTRAGDTGLAAEGGVTLDAPQDEALAKLDAWLCDIKDMRIAEGLHTFGRQPISGAGVLADTQADAAALARLDACAEREMAGLVAALDGRFVEPGPSGAPARGRLDVLPTGRNLVTIDPRMVPTRTAFEIGKRAAAAVIARHLQDHGDWPRRLVIDLWGSATMRTGGEELAQIFAYLGALPVWNDASGRVTGFTILPPAALDRPRIDVTLRLSGLFRDVFPAQIALMEQLIEAIASLDETADDNPLAATSGDMRRIFGPASGTYGVSLGRMLAEDAATSESDLADAYLADSGTALGRDEHAAADLFRARVASADAFVHVQDLPGQDVLDSSAFFEHEGGFAAAAKQAGSKASLYHLDATRTERPVVRALSEEIARAVRGRAANPKWIAGQMQHGYRGAAEIAETVDSLYGFAVTSSTVTPRQFELVFDATLGNDDVLAFLMRANPEAGRAIAQKFDQAMRRGLWACRRNSVAMRLANLLEAA
ncbi:MAG TPA: cobaltochelatase subunit CobN [Methylovirgula sp.]